MIEELKLQILGMIEKNEKEYDLKLSKETKDLMVLKMMEWTLNGQLRKEVIES